jgi:hypothetical protein
MWPFTRADEPNPGITVFKHGDPPKYFDFKQYVTAEEILAA